MCEMVEIQFGYFSNLCNCIAKIRKKRKFAKHFDENIEFLKSIIDLFSNIQIGQEEKFKPVQCGITITTASFIELANYLISERRYVLGEIHSRLY